MGVEKCTDEMLLYFYEEIVIKDNKFVDRFNYLKHMQDIGINIRKNADAINHSFDSLSNWGIKIDNSVENILDIGVKNFCVKGLTPEGIRKAKELKNKRN